mmetsp:Transcript_3994/g.10779  ORF Transcript_3994/g.10779 Transcript_3994/m.10779 type:complete len:245 (-) Transcript_3994:2532-3266(-)
MSCRMWRRSSCARSSARTTLTGMASLAGSSWTPCSQPSHLPCGRVKNGAGCSCPACTAPPTIWKHFCSSGVTVCYSAPAPHSHTCCTWARAALKGLMRACCSNSAPGARLTRSTAQSSQPGPRCNATCLAPAAQARAPSSTHSQASALPLLTSNPLPSQPFPLMPPLCAISQQLHHKPAPAKPKQTPLLQLLLEEQGMMRRWGFPRVVGGLGRLRRWLRCGAPWGDASAHWSCRRSLRTLSSSC